MRIDKDSLLLPQVDEISAGEFVMRYRSLQDKEFRKEVRRARWRESLRSERGALALPFGPFNLQFPLTNRAWPQMTGAISPTPVAVTPTTLGSTTARVFPFMLDGATQVSKIYLNSASAVATSFQLGIFGSAGSQKYASGTQGTSANITIISPTAFKLPSGITHYIAITNANLTSATTAYNFTAVFSAASVARWGTVAATAGAMPASISVVGITATVGGFPIVMLGAV